MTDAGQPSAAYSTWVEGTVVIQPWETVKQAAADRLFHAAAELGLVAFRAPTLTSGGPPRRTWGVRRASRADALSLIEGAATTGVTIVKLVEELYFEQPWSPAHQVAAEGKVRVHLHRLSRAGLVVKRYDRNTGVTVWLAATRSGDAVPVTQPPRRADVHHERYLP